MSISLGCQTLLKRKIDKWRKSSFVHSANKICRFNDFLSGTSLEKWSNTLIINTLWGRRRQQSRNNKISVIRNFKCGRKDFCPDRIVWNLKSATKPFNVLLACTRPLITELSDKLRQKHPLLPTISPYPTMRLEAIRSIITISCTRYPKSVWNTSA